MRTPNFTFNLDCTFSKGVDHRACQKERAAGKNIEHLYYPNETGIYLSWSFAGKYFKQSIGLRIKPKYWDFKLRLPSKKHPNYLELSVLLKSILSRVEKEYLNLRSNGSCITAEVIRQMVKRIVAGPILENIEKKGAFWTGFKEFLSEKEQLTKASTVVKYKSFEKTLKAFEEAKYPLSFENINSKWYTDFMVFSVSAGRLNNTIGKDITQLKAFMNWAFERNMHRSSEFRSFKGMAEVATPIALSSDELALIRDFDPGGRANYGLSRDIFLFGCYTGARISDLLKLKRKDLNVSADGRDMEWELYEQKGNKVRAVHIHIIDNARTILETYLKQRNPGDYVFPRVSSVIINRHLKDIGRAAGLNTLVTRVNYSGKIRKEITVPKFALLSTHIGRKTFVTALCNSNMADHEIQSMTGHASAKEMKPYKAVDKQRIKEGLIRAFGN